MLTCQPNGSFLDLGSSMIHTGTWAATCMMTSGEAKRLSLLLHTTIDRIIPRLVILYLRSLRPSLEESTVKSTFECRHIESRRGEISEIPSSKEMKVLLTGLSSTDCSFSDILACCRQYFSLLFPKWIIYPPPIITFRV